MLNSTPPQQQNLCHLLFLPHLKFSSSPQSPPCTRYARALPCLIQPSTSHRPHNKAANRLNDGAGSRSSNLLLLQVIDPDIRVVIVQTNNTGLSPVKKMVVYPPNSTTPYKGRIAHPPAQPALPSFKGWKTSVHKSWDSPSVYVRLTSLIPASSSPDRDSSWEMMFSRPKALPVAWVLVGSSMTCTTWMWR